MLLLAIGGMAVSAYAADDPGAELMWADEADLGPEILEAAGSASVVDASLVAHFPGGGGEASRFYLSKVLGTTFANVRITAATPPQGGHSAWSGPLSSNASLFTAALAGGVRVPWEYGATRVECEGALRDDFRATAISAVGPAVNVRVSDNWSLLANVWQDLPITKRLGVYAGGGVGGGGYRLAATGADGSTASAQPGLFAWQAGGGATLRYNSLIDLDMSYRSLGFAAGAATLRDPGLGGVGTLSSSMTAGELFFMLRVYEPFHWAKHLRNRDFYLPE